MELRQLITFITIVDLGGFKKAAEKLGYAQPSITAHIKELEKELENPLFDRLGKNIILTQTGEEFLPYALNIIKLYKQAKETTKNTNKPVGKLKIGVNEFLMIYWLPYIIKDFVKNFPDIELIIKSIDHNNLSNQLKKGDIDVAILVEKPDWQNDNLAIQKISDQKLVFAQSSHLLNNYTKTIFVTEGSCVWRPVTEDYLKSKNDTSTVKVELSGVESIKQCILQGLGGSILPYFMIKNEIESGEITLPPTTLKENYISIFVTYHKDKWLSVTLKTLLNKLSDYVI